MTKAEVDGASEDEGVYLSRHPEIEAWLRGDVDLVVVAEGALDKVEALEQAAAVSVHWEKRAVAAEAKVAAVYNLLAYVTPERLAEAREIVAPGAELATEVDR